MRILVVDDDASYARAVADSLGGEPGLEVAGVAGNGVEAVLLARETRPDVVLMDLTMPVLGGLEAIRRIGRDAPGTEFLVLTVQDDDGSLFGAMQAGARGYLLKDAPLARLAPAVRDVAQGMGVLPPALVARVLAEFARLAALPPALQNLYGLLTRQEVEVLRLIGAGKTNVQISAILSVEVTTIKKQVGSLLKKLHVNGRTEAAAVARKSGLLEPA